MNKNNLLLKIHDGRYNVLINLPVKKLKEIKEKMEKLKQEDTKWSKNIEILTKKLCICCISSA